MRRRNRATRCLPQPLDVQLRCRTGTASSLGHHNNKNPFSRFKTAKTAIDGPYVPSECGTTHIDVQGVGKAHACTQSGLFHSL